MNGGTCNYQMLRNGTIRETCTCPTNFSGARCENCSSIECLHGGVCRETQPNKHQCDCPDGFTGLFCEVDLCSGFCQNGGQCTIDSIKGPICTCDDSYSGEKCDKIDFKHVTQMPCTLKCQNGGYCKIGVDDELFCACVGDWKGKLCDMPPRCIDNQCGKCYDYEYSSINECM